MRRQATVCIAALIGFNAMAHDIAVENDDGVTIYYSFQNHNTELAVSYRGSYSSSYSDEYIGNVVIPEYVIYNETAYPVTSIEGGAFEECGNLTSITVGNRVKEIGGGAFNKCIGLTSVNITNSVTNIESGAFANCSGLSSIVIPNSVVSIGERTFYGCSVLTSIEIPDGVTSIRDRIFEGCSKLNAVVIPNSVISIGEFAFYNCSELTSIYIPNGVTNIGYNAFYNCTKLASISIPNSVTYIGTTAFYGTAWYNSQPNGVVYAGKVAYGFKGYMPSNASIELDEGTLGIASMAFNDCSNLTSITIPNSVVCIGVNALKGTAWYNNQPDGLVYAGKVVYKYKGTIPSNAIIVLDEGTLGIAGGAFGGYGSTLTSIYIPNSVRNIGDQAFSNSGSITSITIPNSVTQIGRSAFNNCSGLTSIIFPNSLTSIGNYSFEGCSGLTSVKIPSNLLCIGDGAFYRCTSLTSVVVGSDTPVDIDPYSFTNRTNAILYVPKGSMSSYSSTTYWQDFKTIKEYINGDVNEDGEIDVVDVVDIARFVVDTPSDSFVESLADLDENGSVNVADAIVLVNEIAGDTNFARTRLASSQGMVNNMLSLSIDGSDLSLQMEGDERYAAFQFDLWLPSYINVMQLSLNDMRRQGHQLLYNKIGDGHYRVVALSTSANAFNGTSGELLGITLDNFANDGVYMDNIHFVTADGIDVPYESISVGNATIIRSPEMTICDDQPIYNLNGLRLNSPQKGLNIVGGKKVVVK